MAKRDTENLASTIALSPPSAHSPKDSIFIKLEEVQATEPPSFRRNSTLDKNWRQIKSVSLCFEDISHHVGKDATPIIQEVSGYAARGKILVILGPSGAGKTTLLKCLSGQSPITGGKIYYEGTEKVKPLIHDDILGFNGNAAVVTQTPLLLGGMTVQETLDIAAKLKMTDKDVDLKGRVDHVIDYLGLEGCRDTLVGTLIKKGLSDGEKKRLSIGVELVSQPALLFLDEPTTGLDSTSAYQVLRICNKLAQELGHTVIMTIHQPSSRIFTMLCEWDDNLLLLERGKAMYFGPFRKSVNYFTKLDYEIPPLSNPLDMMLDIVNTSFNETDKHTKKCHEAYCKDLPNIKATIQELNKQANPENKRILKPINGFEQLPILLKRNMINYKREPLGYLLRLTAFTILSVVVGFFYFQIGDTQDYIRDRISQVSFIVGFYSFMMVAAIPGALQDRAVFIRERMNRHYSTFPYALASFLTSLPWIFAMAFSSSLIAFALILSRPSAHYFFTYLAVVFFGLVLGDSIVVAITAFYNNFTVDLALGAGIQALMLTLCGFFLLKSNIPIYWKWGYYGLSYFSYTFPILMTLEFKGYDTTDKHTTNGIVGSQVLELYGFQHVHVGANFGMLFIFLFVFRGSHYAALRWFCKTLA